MIVLAESEGRTYVAWTIASPEDLASPFPNTLFPCLIWDHDGRFTEAQRREVARRLLQAGCRHAVCAGHHSEAWHGAMDEEFVLQHAQDSQDVWEAEFVMTSWHTDESMADVAFFFVRCTNFDDHSFRRFLVLHVGCGPTISDVDAAVRQQALTPRVK